MKIKPCGECGKPTDENYKFTTSRSRWVCAACFIRYAKNLASDTEKVLERTRTVEQWGRPPGPTA